MVIQINGAPVDSPGIKEQVAISKEQLKEMKNTRVWSIIAVIISFVALAVAILTLVFSIHG